MKIQTKIVWENGTIRLEPLLEEIVNLAREPMLTQEQSMREMIKILDREKEVAFEKGKKSVVENIMKAVEKFVQE